MPCDLAFWGRPENQEQVIQTMRRYGFILTTYNNKAASKGDYANYSIPTSIKISHDQVNDYCVYTVLLVEFPALLRMKNVVMDNCEMILSVG